jgi:hypothetical protein
VPLRRVSALRLRCGSRTPTRRCVLMKGSAAASTCDLLIVEGIAGRLSVFADCLAPLRADCCSE